MPKTKYRGHSGELDTAIDRDEVDAWLIAFFTERCVADIRDALTAAGFVVKRTEKFDYHDLWEVNLNLGTAVLPTDYQSAVRQIRKVLVDAGIALERDVLNFTRHGQRVKLTFIYPEGEEGVWY